MKKLFTLLFSLILINMVGRQSAFAQQDAMFSQYMFNGLALNPAYAGSREVLSATALYRNQWVGIEGAPKTMTFSAHSPVRNEKIGLGIIFCTDKIGITNTNNVGLNYAYRIKFKNKGTLSMGLQASVLQYRADFSSIRHSFSPTTFDPNFSQVINRWLPNFGTGIYYYTNKFYLGVSVPNIINNKLTGEGTVFQVGDKAQQYRHLFVGTGYVFELSKSLKLKPSILVKLVKGAPVQFDFNANLWLFDMFAVGLSYRTRDSIDALFEFQITPQLGLGYAYDYTLTSLGRYTSGSHEIMIRYELGFGKRRIITPRYF
ncbi:MAG: type IX secretion system membrane protein PorP/SprF [Cytophagales bacterium]|nr:MAG: type IX secretion system membrane protein PorP/SprF [Cytophagales bacterium]